MQQSKELFGIFGGALELPDRDVQAIPPYMRHDMYGGQLQTGLQKKQMEWTRYVWALSTHDALLTGM